MRVTRRETAFVVETVDVGGVAVERVMVDDSRVAEGERRMEACRPQVRLCNCGWCGRELISETDARQVRKLAEAVKDLFPKEAPAARVKGRPTCRRCVRTKSAFPPPSPPAPAGPSI